MDTVAQQEEGEVWRHRLWGEGHLLDLVDLPEGARFRRRSDYRNDFRFGSLVPLLR